MLTGESLPVFKERGSNVSAGTVNWVSLSSPSLSTAPSTLYAGLINFVNPIIICQFRGFSVSLVSIPDQIFLVWKKVQAAYIT